MKIIKTLALLLVFSIVCIGVSGCMKPTTDKVVYEKEILSFLKGKYHDEFFVNELYQEFEGRTGVSVRATCKSGSYEDEFAVQCYFDSSMAKETIVIDGDTYGISDTYAEVLFQNQLLSKVTVAQSETYTVKCNVDFNSEQPSAKDISCGVECCLQKKELNPYVKFYVLAADLNDARETKPQIKEIIERCNPCKAYIYIAQISRFEKQSVLQTYTANQHDFGNYLTNSAFADTVEFTLYTKDAGFSRDGEVVKE